jgi:fumarate reductase subunit C
VSGHVGGIEAAPGHVGGIEAAPGHVGRMEAAPGRVGRVEAAPMLPRPAPQGGAGMPATASRSPFGLRTQARLWYWQRVSAMVLALCVVVHIVVMIYAVRGGLSAAEILGRTHGSVAFAVFYAVFVAACTVHVPIGLLRIAEEWLGWRGRGVAAVMLLVALLILAMGLRAVYGVIAA